MDCKYCRGKCRRAGRQQKGTQRYFCGICKRYQQERYVYQGCKEHIDGMIGQLVCESLGIRGIGRILRIANNTVLRRIKTIAGSIVKPDIGLDQAVFEVDELWTYIGRKANEYWLVYGLDKATRRVVDFVIGKRTKSTLRMLTEGLLATGVRKLRTDRLTVYQKLIPKDRHHCSANAINHIERKNLSIRTHVKRLSRRTICFSRSLQMLESCIKIYFWRVAGR